jgi:hypothetical protein
MSVVSDYLIAVKKELAGGDATENTYRPALKNLLEASGKNISATNEPRHIPLIGAPDFKVSRGKVPLGHVETKDIGTDLAEMEKGRGPNAEQFSRYRSLPNWILTDYLEFRWYVHGERRRVVRVAELVGKKKIKLLPDTEQQLADLFTAFFNEPALTVSTPKELADSMAGYTRTLRQQSIAALQQETETGWLHQWLTAFRQVLIPDLDEAVFADMFAQTLAYGLFAARVNAVRHSPNKDFTLEMAAFNTPKTNPFLHKLFKEIAGDLPDTIRWTVDDIVDLLHHANMPEILKDFGKGKGKDDPVVHFYETFLASYDPKLRELRGVFYTPLPVVSYIVRSIDHLLKTRFDRPAGLADENTLILDPATGTATFLYEVIRFINEQRFKNQPGAWNSYVPKKLLPRVFGFELLMAPYAIAHLKLAMLLEDTGYKFETDQRLGVYLTNTLEETARISQQIVMGFMRELTEEANAASDIKAKKPIMVVLGNPPYSKVSANRSADAEGNPTFIGKLIEDYRFVDGKPLGERNPKWLQDDYVKFVRFAQWRIALTGKGIVGFITNHGYLDNPTFRGMRRSLLKTFDEIFIYNLHGNTRKQEKAPDGSEDQNVFDIQQGVAIILCVKQPQKSPATRVRHADLWGMRATKYQQLVEGDIESVKWRACKPVEPSYLFVPQDMKLAEEYNLAWPITQVFQVYASTVTTARNDFSMAYGPETLVERISDLRDQSLDDETIRRRYDLKDVSYWRLADARRQLKDAFDIHSFVLPYCYRPFDFRFVFYHEAVCERLRPEVMQHMHDKNVAILTHRPQSPADFTYMYCTTMIGDQCVAANKTGGGGNSFQFPLYLFDVEKRKRGDWGKAVTMMLFETSGTYQTRRPNFGPAFLKALAEKLQLPQTQPHGLPKGVTPESIFHYAYAVFHSPTYRQRYAEFLKIDFPRLPLTSDVKLFRALAVKGAELVALHLLESPKVKDVDPQFCGKGDNSVEKVQFVVGRVTSRGDFGPTTSPAEVSGPTTGQVWVNANQYFDAVPKNIWEFHIGGYRPCDKWLKDRKGRTLSCDDMQHYRKIVVAQAETIRLMAEIDTLIPSWPIK